MDAMDETEWCLCCDRNIEGKGSVYCSADCYDEARQSSMQDPFLPTPPPSHPSTSHTHSHDDPWLIHPIHDAPPPEPTSLWHAHGADGIRAWAQNVPAGSPRSPPAPPRAPTPQDRTPTQLRQPALLLPHQRPIPPSLCMSTPQPRAGPAPAALAHPKSLSSASAASSESAAVSALAGSRRRDQKPGVLGQVRAWFTPPPSRPTSHTHMHTHAAQSKFTVLARAGAGEDEGVWWVSGLSGPARQPRRAASLARKFTEAEARERPPPTSARTRTRTPPGLAGGEHPAYASRGRKPTKAIQ